MILKNNSISDRDIILKLQEASCAGVRIDMIAVSYTHLFNVCQKYPQVPITVPVDDGGYLTELAGKYAGQRVWAANKTILADLTESGAVMGQVHIKHQYPHCWRCHHPIIFRATEQWFCSIAKFREDVYKAIDTVTWMPDWGHDRMKGMVRDRNDWCISRQRTWGVPIPAFYCKKCGTYHITDATIKAVSDLFRKEEMCIRDRSPAVQPSRRGTSPRRRNCWRWPKRSFPARCRRSARTAAPAYSN